MKEETKEELFIPKTKYKGLKICLAILLIAGLIVGGYFLYQRKFNNPKEIISNVLKDAREEIKESFKEYNPNSKYKLDGHIKLDSNIDDETIQILKDIELQFSGEMDSNESISNYQINAKYKNDKIIDVDIYQEKNIVYLLLQGLYDKYLKIDANIQKEELTTVDIPQININPSDLQVIFDSIITSLEKEITKMEIIKTDATITIDGKEKNVLNNYVEFKDKELNNFIKNIILNLKNDKKFIETINNIVKTDISSAFNELEHGLEEEFQGIYRINFYTDKGLFNKKVISIRQTFAQNGVTMSINVDKIDENEIMISLIATGMSYSIKIKNNNSAINVLIGLNTLGQYINVDINMNYDEIKEINKVDVSNSIDINNLTEKEIEEINQKLMDNKTLLKLIEEINKLNKKEA